MIAKDYKLEFQDSIDQVPVFEWIHNYFLQRKYLKMLELAQPIGMTFQYVVVSKNEEPIGFFYYQIIEFSASNSLQAKNTKIAKGSLSTCIKSFLSNFVQFKTIVAGNLTLTGNNAYVLKYQNQDDELVHYVTDRTIQYLNHHKGEEVTLVLLKDFPHVQKKDDAYYHKKYYPFCIDPDMNLSIPSHWHRIEDYCADLTTKYRTRFNRARKKIGDIASRKLDQDALQLYQKDIYQLYLNVAQKADFNTVYLSEHYFTTLTTYLGSEAEIQGYFLGDKLVGFISLLHVGDELEAHYIGYDVSVNAHHQLYLNMLYDIVQAGIDKACTKIGFARTATEIKSSIGATASQYWCYLKHTKPIINKCIPALFQYLTPVEDWEKRNPFKNPAII